MGANQRSLAYRLTYQSAERTLAVDEINTWHDAIKTDLKKQLGAEFAEE